MSHPQMFDNDDPVLAKLQEICLAFPGADVKVSHGRPCFFTKKIFASYGAVTKGDHNSGAHDQAVIFMPDDDERPALDQDDRFFIPAYWGPSGWRAIDLDDSTDWEEIIELLDTSYRLTAPKKLIAELDAAS
ncbi:MAG: MmcQ/YjbR family DNA-binding protein [Actinomycetota bacterium]